MASNEGWTTHDETPWAVKAAHRVPTTVFGGLLLVALVAGALTLQTWETATFGAISACCSALSAAGFVLHDRPRVLSKLWADLYWDPDIADLASKGLIDYDSEASGVWVIRESEHRKGKFPTMRIIERSSTSSPWTETGVDFIVSAQGDITVRVDVLRTAGDAGREVAIIIE